MMVFTSGEKSLPNIQDLLEENAGLKAELARLSDRRSQLSTPVDGEVREALNAEAINDLVAGLKRRADSCAKQAKKKSGGDRCVVKGKEAAYSHAAQLVAEAANLAQFPSPAEEAR